MPELVKVIADIELFAGENMRQIPFVSKYRPAFDFTGAKTKISGRIDLINMNEFAPGKSGIVQVTFIKGIIPDSYFKKGQLFTISEGGRYDLGKGIIIEKIDTPTVG